MRKKDLIARMGSECKPCLVCDPALDEIRKRGFSDLAFLLRRIAEDLWTDSRISEEEKRTINDHVVVLMDVLFCESVHHDSEVGNIVSQIEREVPHDSNLYDSWLELREIIKEVRAT